MIRSVSVSTTSAACEWVPGNENSALAALLERYGEAIEADLAREGHSLVAIWQDRRWRFLLNLIDHLPRTSYFVEAISQDDELAESLPDSPAYRERTTTWTPEREALAGIYDRLGTLLATTIAASGGQPPDLPRFPVPETAAQRARTERGRRRHEQVVERLLRR